MREAERAIAQLHEALNYFRAIQVVNKEDWETTAKAMDLDSSVQLNILWIVYCYEGVRVTQIADWTFWHPSSIVIHVKKLMEKNLVTIEKSSEDGRVVNVYLTEKGRESIHYARTSVPEIFRLSQAIESLQERYGPNVLALFYECLDHMAKVLHGEDKVKWIKESSAIL